MRRTVSASGRVARVATAGAVLAAVIALGAGPASARPDSTRGRINGQGTMVGDCQTPGTDGVRLSATATLHAQYLGNGVAVWTTCILQFGGTHLDVAPQTFQFTSNGGTLSGTITDATLQHVIGGQCLPSNLIGQWTVTVTVENLVGSGKFAKVSGGQLDLVYEWARADGGVCAELPGFPSRDMILYGTVSGSLS